MYKNRFLNTIATVGLCLAILSLGGCTPIEDRLAKEPKLEYSTMNPLTVADWTTKINRLILPLLNDGETYMSLHLDIVRGEVSISSVISMVDSTIDKTQKALEEIEATYPPSGYEKHKADTIEKLKSYKTALLKYRKALESKDTKAIKQAADLLKAEFAALKTVHEVYQR